MSSVYVIIPVYNEASVIGSVIKGVQEHFQNIICVNDGSRDKSSEAIRVAGAALVEHSVNLGAGGATQTGVEYALQDPDAKYFITIDADGQHKISDAKKMLEVLKAKDLDFVIGSRFLGQVENIDPVKNIFLKFAALFSGATSGVQLTDPHVGLRVFNRKFAEQLNITLPGFAHASEIVHRLASGDYKYAEVPITVTYSDYSKAKGQSMLNAINIMFDLLHHRITKK